MIHLRNILLIVLFVALKGTDHVRAQYIDISGTVLDGQTKKPLPFASVRVLKTGIGTSTNNEGYFLLKTPERFHSDSLEISFVGYKAAIYLISSFPKKAEVQLDQAVSVLAEVTVKAQTGLAIIKEAISKVPVNYDTVGKNLQSFYHEEINLGKDSISYLEAVFDIYKSSYTAQEDKDQIKLLKGRKKRIRWKPDPLYGWVSGLSNGGRGSLAEDLLRHLDAKNNPFNSKNFVFYNFDLRDVINQGSRTVYVIDFSPTKKAPRSKLTIKGSVYVDTESMAIERIEFNLAPGGVRYLNNHRGFGYRIMTVAYQASVRFDNIHEVISYSEVNNKWYLKQVQKEFSAKLNSGKRNMKDTPWKAGTLFVVTDVRQGKGEHILSGDLMDNNKPVSWLIGNNFDKAFWENYNVVQLTPVDSLEKRKVGADSVRKLPRVSNRKNGFTRADTLQGKLTPLRTCYDVTFYHLDVEVDPAKKWIGGSSVIRFKVVEPFSKIQVDLYANMKIEKILYRGQELSYSREFNAVFINFPSTLAKGTTDEIKIYYSGVPQEPNFRISMNGGFLWSHDKNGKPWVQVACQGSGASLWWPNKDHLSDEPDSARITVTVPKGLIDISNGRLRSKTDIDNKTKYDWYVSYPINNYNITANIGDYAHFDDKLIRGNDTLTLDYYCMPYHLEKAKRLFKGVKPMLRLYEKDFGAFPFPRDGFVLMESLYPMEHQSAVSIGKLGNENQDYVASLTDSLQLLNLMWHEASHEWWGNSVSCPDFADFWIHEGFATYCEALMQESVFGYKASAESLNNQTILNKEPIIGVYDVNHIFYEIGDIYNKSGLMLNTLRHVIDNDSLWFSILHGIQDRFKYQIVTTNDIITFINQKAKTDYTYFFDQYLRYAAIPDLRIKMTRNGSSLSVQYKWNAEVDNFKMPVKIKTAPGKFSFIYPTTRKWQTVVLPNMTEEDFEVAENDFYVDVTVESE